MEGTTHQYDNFWSNGLKAYLACLCGDMSHGGVEFRFEYSRWKSSDDLNVVVEVNTCAPIRLRERLKHAYYLLRYGVPRYSYFQICREDITKFAIWVQTSLEEIDRIDAEHKKEFPVEERQPMTLKKIRKMQNLIKTLESRGIDIDSDDFESTLATMLDQVQGAVK